MIAANPGKFFVHRQSDQRYNWIDTYLSLTDMAEIREFVTDAWCMVVPKGLAAAHLGPSHSQTKDLYSERK